MLKVSYFEGVQAGVPTVIPLFGPADPVFEKVASPYLLPEVQRYIGALRPRDNAQYVLVNAMGASEYYSSNSNGDAFTEASLIHSPDDWTGDPVLDRPKGLNWAYGFPTFYNAKAFAHHRNKVADRGLGDVELASWNPRMRRVELVVRVDKDRCQAFDGQGTWDKLKSGSYCDVSMGTRVPFDTCNVCLDTQLYQEAWSTFDPHQHKSPGEAILEFHKKLKARDGLGIRGLSITRKDYCQHCIQEMNRIYPDGRKVFVYNDFPRFFDISFVFIGADKIAKVMLKIADGGRRVFMGAAELAEKLGMVEESSGHVKAAGLTVTATRKQGEMSKEVVPNYVAGKAVPLLSRSDPDLSDDSMRVLKGQGLDRALATTAGMGMVLKPGEFQELVLSALGQPELAELLKSTNKLFPSSQDEEGVEMSPDKFSPSLARALIPEMPGRSAFGPIIERRLIIIASGPKNETIPPTSHPEPILNKIGAAYNSYRKQLMDVVAGSQGMIEKVAGARLGEIVEASPEVLFTPLTYQYLKHAFLADVPGYLKAINDKTVLAGALGRP
jgi:hypothetical protein